MNEIIKIDGWIEIIKEWNDDNKKEIQWVKNTTLRSGRIAIVNSLANNFGGTFDLFISSMVFGSGGTSGGTPRFVNDTLEGLFPPTTITKGVIISVPVDTPTMLIATSVLTYDDANGTAVNEAGLQLKSGDFLNLATFGDINKTSNMQLTFNWRISMI